MLIKLKTKEQQIAEFKREWDSCEKCAIGRYARNHVQYELSPENKPIVDVMFLGEAPGEEEDKTGTPFVGPSGKFLRRAIAKATEGGNYSWLITNTIACRPCEGTYQKNRQPTWQEISNCEPRWIRLVEIFKPQIVVCLGNTAKEEFEAMYVHFKWEDESERASRKYVLNLQRVIMRHPSYMLRINYTEQQFSSYVETIRNTFDWVESRKSQGIFTHILETELV